MLLKSCQKMRGAPRELWVVFLLKFIESYGYFSMSLILTIYLSREFGLTDVQAGIVYGLFGAMCSASGFVIGFVIDNIGVRLSLILGFSLLLISRITMATTDSLLVLKLNLYLLLPVGTSLGIPVMSLGIKRYTTEENRGFAFGLFYATMNVAALLSGWIVDALNMRFKGGVDIFDRHFSGDRLVLLSGAASTAVGLLISICAVREVKVEETGAQSGSSSGEEETVQEHKVKRTSPVQIMRELLCLKFFWRFMGITIICVNLKMIFRYLDASLPKYLVREFGEDVPKGTIYSINPGMIIFLVPLISAFTSDWQPYDMIHYGSYISALSVLPLVLSTTIWSAAAFVAILSLGEAIWSPRFYDLTVSMAPEGREGTFVAMGSAPMFLAKFPVGLLSGYLLQQYCPEEGPRQSQTMWGIIFAMTISSPILLTMCQKCLRPKAEDSKALGAKKVPTDDPEAFSSNAENADLSDECPTTETGGETSSAECEISEELDDQDVQVRSV